MTATDADFSRWDWEDPDSLNPLMESFTATLAEAESVRPIALAPPYDAASLAGLGITGVEFAAFKTAHPAGLAADLVGVHSPDATTEPGGIYRIDDESYFVQLDISQPLPFADAAVGWVYAEHLIEHVPLPVAVRWLREVHRILVPGGRLRLTTPDLGKYVEGYLAGEKFFARHRRRVDLGIGVAPPMPARNAFMFNQIFYLYGHKWLYDQAELEYVLTQAGFEPAAIEPCSYRCGADAEIANLDQMFRNDETLYLEVVR